MIHVDVSVLLPLRDAEPMVAPLVRTAELVQEIVMDRHHASGRPLAFEFLALDERSGDNTASVLSVLHGQQPQLRTIQDLDRGSALRHAARLARGDVWLVLDHPVDPDLAAWAVGQIIVGQRAAIIPGELLALHRSAGVDVLRALDGGLVVAQRVVARYLRRLGETPAFSPAPGVTRLHRALVFLRGHTGRVGLGFLDRPLPGPLRPRQAPR
ncbi:MAG: hypothetical protein K1X88_01425 [Nannocystaceae bacterium]|nr:hypothetical protein [Nannocystaceae bacterium]